MKVVVGTAEEDAIGEDVLSVFNEKKRLSSHEDF